VLGGLIGAGGTYVGSKIPEIKKVHADYTHTTKAANVDSILNDGKLKISQQLDDAGKPVVSSEFDSKPGVFMSNKDHADWLHGDAENVQISFKKKAVGKVDESGTQVAARGEVPVTPKTVNEVRVGSEEVAQKFRDKGFKKVTVDEALVPKMPEPKPDRATQAAAALTGSDEVAAISAPVVREATPAAKLDPDMLEVQDAVNKAKAEGRLDEAQALNDTLPPEAQVNLADDVVDFEVPDKYVQEYADMMKSVDDGAVGGQMVPDGEGGYKRVTEHSPFYRQYYKEHKRKPSKKAWLEYAKENVKNDKEFMDYVKSETSKTEPLQQGAKGANASPKPKVRVYHGSNVEFVGGKPKPGRTAYKNGGRTTTSEMSFFSDNRDVSDFFAKDRTKNLGGKESVTEYDLDESDILDWSNLKENGDLYQEFFKLGYKGLHELEAPKGDFTSLLDTKRFKESLQKAGYKGVKFKEKDGITYGIIDDSVYTPATAPKSPPVQKAVAPVEKPIPKPPTVETLEAPDGFRALDDVDINEVTSGKPVDQTTSTIAEQKAKFIGSDLNRLAEETGVGLARVDEDIAEDISKRLQGTTDQATTKNSIVKSIANQFQDTITVAAKTVGKEGVDFVHNLLGGEKFKRESLNILRDDLAEIQKLGSKLTGKTSKFKKPSRTARVELGAKLGAALDDRANAANYLKTPDEMKLFEHYVKVFDFVKARREEFGMEVVENYRPWVNLRDASEDPTWLVKGLTDSKIETLSRFSKERVRDEAGDNVDENLLDMIYGYVNSQLNEMAYDAPVRKFKKDVANSTMNPNSPQYREGMDYLSEVLQQAVSPKAKNKVEKIVLGAGNRVYSSVLPFNPKLTMQNMTQRWAANSRVSKGAVSLSKKMRGAEFKELEHGLVFGDQTVFGQLEDISAKPTGTSKGFKDKAKNLDYYQKSETKNVTTSFRKGAAQAIIESEPYKAARKQGMNSTDAMKAALQDETVKKNAIQRGNMVVNDTQFGASHIARPAALRSEGSVLGVPIKALTMFTRFPIGMSQHVLEMVDGKSARALDVLKNGDPRSVPIAEMRSSYGTLLEALKDSKKAVDDGVDIGISKEALDGQISLIDKNLKVIDKELKKHSSVRTGKTAKNLVKMWTAAAAIQVLFDGGIQTFAEDPLDPVAKTNPTATGMVFGKNSKLGGFTSAAIPVNKYGLNERALTNYIPGVGLAVNRARDVGKLYNALTGEQEE